MQHTQQTKNRAKQNKTKLNQIKQNKEVAQGLMEDATAAAAADAAPHWMRLREFLLAFYLSGLFWHICAKVFSYFAPLFCQPGSVCAGALFFGIGMPNESISAAGHVCT